MTRMDKAIQLAVFFFGVLLFYIITQPRRFWESLKTKAGYQVCGMCGVCVDANFVPGYTGVTAGYYHCPPDSGWAQFSGGHDFLCDPCMQSRPEYVKVYGKVNNGRRG